MASNTSHPMLEPAKTPQCPRCLQRHATSTAVKHSVFLKVTRTRTAPAPMSSRSVSGVVPSAALADGRLSLVLVHKCNHIQYLRFLLMLARGGLRPGLLSFVEVVSVDGLQVQ